MKKLFPRWLKILLIIVGIVVIAGAIILLVDNESQQESAPNHESTEVLALHPQTISNFEC